MIYINFSMFIFHQNIAKFKVQIMKAKKERPPKSAVLCSFYRFLYSLGDVP